MKSIKKLKTAGKAVAGSALLVGATLTGAAGFAAAQDSGSMDLGDYPSPFVDEDGNVASTIVVGDSAKTIDVVGAVNIAGSLSQSAFTEEPVSTGGGVVSSWSAENGVTLNRRNSHIFFPESTDSEQTRLDGQDVSALETVTVQSESNEEVEIEHDLQVGNQAQGFNADVGDIDDPVLHVENPTSPSVDSDYLMQASVSFDETIDFTVQESDSEDIDGNADEAFEDGDTIELFGQEYTYSDESDNDELVLYGSSERFEVDTGESQTVEVDGEEATFEAQYVESEGSSATVTVDGDTQSLEEGDSVTVNDQEVRVSDIYRTGPDGQGRVAFSIGSQELVITDSDVEVGGDSVDGVDVSVDSNPDDTGVFSAVDGITFAFGSQDSDENYIEAGDSYETPVFGLEFHYGGLSPNAAEDPAEVLELDVEEDEDAEFTFTNSDGEEGSVTVAEYDNSASFATSDGTIAQYEGQTVTEDDYVVLNAFEEADMYEVTDVDDTDLEDENDEDGSISVTLQNVHTGDSVTVEEDGIDFTDNANQDSYTIESESIEGKDFDVTFDTDDDVSFVRSTADGDRQLWPHMYSATDGAVAFDDDGSVDLSDVFTLGETDFSGEDTFTTAGSSGTVTVSHGDSDSFTLSVYDVDAETYVIEDQDVSSGSTTIEGSLDFDGSEYRIEVEDTDEGTVSASGAGTATDASATMTAERTAELPSGVASNDASVTVTFDGKGDSGVSTVSDPQDFVEYSITGTQDVDLGDRTGGEYGVLVTQPENDNDEEEAYVLDVAIGESTASIGDVYSGDRETDTLDDEDVDVGYDEYGAYSEYDHDDSGQETLTLNLPDGQATAGMAVTGTDGSISASGGASGDAVSQSPAGWPDSASLDSDGNIDSVKTSQNTILVGGPAVNALTDELAQDNMTMSGSEYQEGDQLIQLVEDSFADDVSSLVVAGYSGEDTRAAANYVADYADHQDELSGQDQVNLRTMQTTQ